MGKSKPYAQVLGQVGRSGEADATIKQAMAEFKGSTEEVRVMIANCDLALLRGDTSRALKMLLRIPSDSPHYPKAGRDISKQVVWW